MQESSSTLRDRLRQRPTSRGFARLLGVAVPALLAATFLVGLLESRFGVLNASPVYLLAVVVTALLSGTAGALLAAVTGTLLYDYLFVDPIHTLTINDPGEWLNLVLLLFVGLVVGQLTALERARALTAEAREQEARELFLVSRSLATRASTTAVLQEIAEHVRRAAGMTSVWMSLGPHDGAERIAALAGEPPPPRTPALHWVLRRMPGDEPATWIRIHAGSGPGTRPRAFDPAAAPVDRVATYRVRIEAGARGLGSVWSTRPPRSGHPDRSATRLVSAAADQVGQALAQDELASDVRAAEVARQSDALKSALLQSVSHDLRTPLATIRAAAGSLRPDTDLDAEGRLASADAIEREVRRLDRLVANLLDLGRIEAGALRAEVDVFELDDLAGRIVDRMASRFANHTVEIEIDSSPVLVDPVFLDEALTNLLDNALKFAGPGSTIRVVSSEPEAERAGERVRLVVEDGGPGVPDELLDRVFEPFFRGPATGRDIRAGTGIGLAVVRGLVEAMGGSVRAGRSELGGLAVTLDLPRASLPAELVPTSTP